MLAFAVVLSGSLAPLPHPSLRPHQGSESVLHADQRGPQAALLQGLPLLLERGESGTEANYAPRQIPGAPRGFAALAAQDPPQTDPPQTRPERTGWTATSTNADVAQFLAALGQLPGGARLQQQTLGHTVQGTPLTAVRVRVGEPAGTATQSAKLRALVIGNIHGGEVEGKETIQQLLREIVLGQHDELLAKVDLVFVPVFNCDGNDEIEPTNRVEQNGPTAGVGRRHNSQDRDLNRDFVKLESPEVRALVALMGTFDPHLFMDLHTTNGSHHGYHLTYCTSLAVNCDPAIATLMHERFIPTVRARMLEAHGLRIFDYGNFGRSGPASGWQTFSADPRLAINYVGLRNRLSLLSEAYSYLPFDQRARVTRAFVLESLRELVARGDEVRTICAKADADAAANALPFRFQSQLAPPTPGELLVGSVERVDVPGLGQRLVAKPEFEKVTAPLQTRFVAGREQPMPEGWAVVGSWPLVAQILRAHGLPVFTLREPLTTAAESLQVGELTRQRAPFQGHRLVKLGGKLEPGEFALPAGTLVIPAKHALGRLAAQLLEGVSDDSLATWGYFDGAVRRADEPGASLPYPVLRLRALPAAAALLPLADDPAQFPRLVPYDVPARPDEPVAGTLTIEVLTPGKRSAGRGFEAESRYEGRTLRWRIPEGFLGEPAELVKWFESLPVDAARAVAIRRGPGVTHREILETTQVLVDAGCARVLLVR